MRTITRLAVSLLVSSLALSGFSYAGTGAPNPVEAVKDAVLNAFTATQVTTLTETDEPTEAFVTEEEPVEDAEVAETAGVERSTDGCPEGFTGNHGQYVSSVPVEERSEAAHSNCGKPLSAVNRPRHEGEPGSGRPAHAGPPSDRGNPSARPEGAGPPEGKGPAARGGPDK